MSLRTPSKITTLARRPRTPEHYRGEAGRLRQAAATVDEERLRGQLLSFASDYEDLATTLDEIAKTKLKPWPEPRSPQMVRYRVHFVDHGNNVYDTVHAEHDNDEAAVEYANRINVPSIGAGFDIWERERLVHRHRN